MKALLSKTVGGPESLVIEDLPAPTPGRGEVVIAVAACAVNFPDVLIISDKYQFKPMRPFAPGGEVAGVVKVIGEGVRHLAVASEGDLQRMRVVRLVLAGPVRPGNRGRLDRH